MLYNIGVALVERQSHGIKYTLTDDSRHIVGIVEESCGMFNVRDFYDEPVSVGSRLYNMMTNAVREYKAWAAGKETSR